MEKPPIPNASPSSKPAPKSNPKRKIPSPKELISHYESQGMDAQEASIKVIEDLQRALFGVISSGRGKKDKLLVDSSRKMDAVNGRLAVLDMKLAGYVGYVETFAIGVTSAATLRGIGAIMPHIIAQISQIWNSVTTATKSTPQ
ncbi:uncharacterized protein LOC110266046 [Arachis ipaensis]|uniref:uncharacterized protein LOC110266046 n=1 Tax=Arachis ipaensis TaxID=130454 RepID=UPI000A2B703B|nr:uncharacterized protein LOC110266046 [Arachis ipaensis]XP_020965443.1 uncharacterized protein LOC110266046 [Arachis ipaensis]XP_020965444.1 uncharacterized protein LOC110266046 [Arachis ipaensis]